jgi:hypothetical protein
MATMTDEWSKMVRSGTPPALAMVLVARAWHTTTRELGKRLAQIRRLKRLDKMRNTLLRGNRQRVGAGEGGICVECGILPAEIDGRCRSCSMCVANPRE